MIKLTLEEKQSIKQSFDYHGQDVKNILEKPHLITAMASHIHRDTKLKENLIKEEISTYYK